MARRLLLTLFLLGFAVLASATKIQTSDPACNPSAKPITSGNFFAFQADALGQGDFFFCNKTTQDWETLLVAIQTQVPLFVNHQPQITCNTTVFLFCLLETSPSNPGVIYAFFANPCAGNQFCTPQEPGIPINEQLQIDLNCNDNGPCTGPPGWGPDAGVNVYTNPPATNGLPILPPFRPVPEPATITLLITGLGAAYLKRRRRF